MRELQHLIWNFPGEKKMTFNLHSMQDICNFHFEKNEKSLSKIIKKKQKSTGDLNIGTDVSTLYVCMTSISP